MAARQYLRVFSAYVQLHVKTALEYRTNFLMQSGFMFLNDIMWIFIWYFLFRTFDTVNGYTFSDALLVFATYGLAFGILAVFFGNRQQLSEIIMEGQLDSYLSFPVDELFHSLIAKSSYDGVADIIYALLIIAIFAPSGILIAILVAIFGAIALLSFMILIESTGFWLDHPKSATKSLRSLVGAFSAWPIDTYPATARTLLYIVPIAFIGTVPSHLVRSFTFAELGVLVLVSLLLFALAISVWRIGVRRYESGNMMTTRI